MPHENTEYRRGNYSYTHLKQRKTEAMLVNRKLEKYTSVSVFKQCFYRHTQTNRFISKNHITPSSRAENRDTETFNRPSASKEHNMLLM